jgi:hypothetical protein
MQASPLSAVLDDFGRLDLPDKEYALEILRKKLIDERRRKLLGRAHAAMHNYKAGKTRSGSVTGLLRDLNGD